MERLVLALNHTNSSAFQRLLYQTIFLVEFYSFFRVGELTAKEANSKPRALSIRPKNSGNSGFGSEWNRHFPEFHSQILGVPREVGLKFRKIGITGKFHSIRPFLLAPSFSEPGNRTQYGFQFFHTPEESFGGGMAARPDPFPSGILPVGMTARVNSPQVSLVFLK